MIAYAIDEAFHQAVNECVSLLGQESFSSWRYARDQRLHSNEEQDAFKDDHRYRQKPRPAHNGYQPYSCRGKDSGCMISMLDVPEVWPVCKMENEMSHDRSTASQYFHLRKMMVSVVYEHRGSSGEPVTFSMLCSDETVQRKWEEYRAATRVAFQSIWKKRVDMAEEWLRHPSLANDVVKIVAEVQCVLSEYRDVRLRMHETYKVFRAVDGASLHLDYVQTVEKQKEKSK